MANGNVVLENMQISHTNNQNGFKTQTKIWISEDEKKDTIITIMVPNPTLSKYETLRILKEKADIAFSEYKAETGQ